ncbi:hypothetical protein QTP88_026960 [Uroleucon formosanum]
MPLTPSSVASNTRAQSQKSPSTSDILKAIESLSTSQSSQFSELKSSISTLTSQVADLVTENASFRAEIGVLRSRIDVLESRLVPSIDSSSVIFRESTERSKIEFNAYGLPESAANTAALRVNDDLRTLSNLLEQITLPADASQLILNFNLQTRNGLLPEPGFRIVRDKTTLERELLRKAHSDLQRKIESGSSDFTISYVNSVPSVTKAGPKNMNPKGGSNHQPSSTQHLP